MAVLTGITNRANVYETSVVAEEDSTTDAKGQREKHARRNGSARSTMYRRNDGGEGSDAIRKMYFAKDRETALSRCGTAAVAQLYGGQSFHATFTILFRKVYF